MPVDLLAVNATQSKRHFSPAFDAMNDRVPVHFVGHFAVEQEAVVPEVLVFSSVAGPAALVPATEAALVLHPRNGSFGDLVPHLFAQVLGLVLESLDEDCRYLQVAKRVVVDGVERLDEWELAVRIAVYFQQG